MKKFFDLIIDVLSQEKRKDKKLIYSMTGFGSNTVEMDGYKVAVEVKTLNHRYLDVNIRLPKSINYAEKALRDIVKDHLYRGRVEIYIRFEREEEDGVTVNVNKGLLSSYIQAFNEIKQNYNIENDITLSSIIHVENILNVEQQEDDKELVISLLTSALKPALSDVVSMRKVEGEKLAEDFSRRLGIVSEQVSLIENRSPVVMQEYKEKLRNRIDEILDEPIDEQRLSTEVALLADRSNITEEIVRLKSHLIQFKSMLNVTGTIGRKLDFLTQELNRETNTIGSKTTDLEIVNRVVDIKSEIEKIREQVQNIE